MKDEVVKNILEVGTELILEHGYHGVGLNKILDEANIPKGSFYYYFNSKEDFGIQVVQHYSIKSLALLNNCLNDETKDPRERIISFFGHMKSVYQKKGYKEGCLLGNCSLELSDFSEGFRKAIMIEFGKWEDVIENCIREGQERGNIKSLESAQVLSSLILMSWEGALLRMKVAKNADPIETFINFLDDYVL
ncbi:TetR family transcriptional regulator [Flagellimonas lutimaris]|uniref:TetR family transcriptional regulator n=1 Tax=Flagellimonas lutimaris TaxID=475082 RepID=A0A3A1NAU3_9FLAO|nr:TetR/AcrR family transcriptional regulator [Allomuricauda lutimaris]RIV36684.1 TetR family transcriptional regulator [Allomuricauda lutimaris]